MDPGRMRIRIRNTEWRINALQQHYQARVDLTTHVNNISIHLVTQSLEDIF
jgi:hypothetical protein